MVKVKKTYSRKKNVRNINLHINYNIINTNIVNIINISSSGKSESGDTFDQLMKGPIYNPPNMSPASSSEYRDLFFKRQETFTFYKSDSDSCRSTAHFKDPSSAALFKDPSSDPYSFSNAVTPDRYCKNKLGKNYKVVREKKQSNRVTKKRLKKVQPKKVEKPIIASAVSSTPTYPNVVLSRSNWQGIHVSPIMPPRYSPCMDFSTEDLFAINENRECKNIVKKESVHGLTALLEGFGNLGITQNNNFVDEKYHRGKAQEQHKTKHSSLILRNSNDGDKNQHANNFNHGSKPQHENSEDCKKSIEFKFSSPVVGDGSVHSSENIANPNLNDGSKPSKHKDPEDRKKSIEHSEFKCLPSVVGNGSLYSRENIVNPNLNLSDFNEPNCLAPLSKHINQDSLKDINNTNNIPITEHINEKSESCKHVDTNCSKNILMSEVVHKSQLCDSSCSHEFGVLNNLAMGNCDHNKSMRNQEESFSLGKENIKPDIDISNNIMIERKQNTQNENSLQLSVTDTRETVSKLSLDPGKQWRRSLLRQKQKETKLYSKRCTVGPTLLAKLFKDASISTVKNETKLSCSTKNITLNSLTECALAENTSLSTLLGSPDLNYTVNKLSKVQMRKRRNNIRNWESSRMHEIPEESFNNLLKDSQPETKLHELDTFPKEKNQGGKSESLDVVVQESDKYEGKKIETSYFNTSTNTSTFETPPILRMNSEALSAITDRKKRLRPITTLLEFSPEDHSIYSNSPTNEEFLDKEEVMSAETDMFASCCSVLEDEEEDCGLENFDVHDMQLMGKMGVLFRCTIPRPASFFEAFPDRLLDNGRKIGEGVYGEVFMLKRPGEGKSVVKIIPVEGSQRVNGEPQKLFEEVLSELIITEELSLLCENSQFCTSGFCELKGKFCLQGKYPSQLINHWHEFSKKKGTENDCPDVFGNDQLYLALELEHAGDPVDAFPFNTPQQAFSVFLQTTFALAVAESALDFEHRDLHIGNILVKKTTNKFISYTLKDFRFQSPSFGIKATIIDYTLSRISFKGDVLFFDLEKDPELFMADTKDYQFDVYRHMRSDLARDWRLHQPKTNIRWLHYLIDKFTSSKGIKYKQKKSAKVYKLYMEKMERLRDILLDFYSATDLTFHLTQSYCPTMSIIKTN